MDARGFSCGLTTAFTIFNSMNVAELRQLIREELESTTSKNGFYWVKYNGNITIGERLDTIWYIVGSPQMFTDVKIQAIKRIPDLQGKPSVDVERHLSAASDHIDRIA